MKKIMFIGLAVLAMASCSKSTDVYDPGAAQKTKEQVYADAFAQKFGGAPSATQTWGFNQTATTRSADPRGNMWASEGYNVPGAITDTELQKVLAVFNVKEEGEQVALVNWDCFFVQQVYKGTATYNDANGNNIGVASDKMNWLCAYDPNGHEETTYPAAGATIVTSHDDHINNFNAGTCKDYNGIMLMLNSSTSRFGFTSSLDNGRVFYNFRMEEIDGNYYVGFDFEAAGQNSNEQVARDYIYNDWIVKIVPGEGTPDKVKEQGIIICEDLGTIGDFDFNDVVFEAKVWESGKTNITLLAAGGTLDLTVAGVEVHEKFGVEKKADGTWPMINTGDGETKDAVTFTATNTYNSLVEIPIVVKSKDAAGNVTSFELTAQIGKAPQKICVPVGFKWTIERKSLVDAYPGFKEWSTGAASTWAGTYKPELVYKAE